MKSINALFFCLALPFFALAQTNTQTNLSSTEGDGLIHWMTMEEALAAQKKAPRKIMIDVYTQWCGPCKMLDKNTFHNQQVADYVNANYYAVKFDAESPEPVVYQGETFSNPDFKPENVGRRNGVHQLSRKFQVSAYPTIVMLDEQANVIAPLRGYKTPGQMELYLKFFKADKHKEIVTQQDWEAYRDAFVPSWE